MPKIIENLENKLIEEARLQIEHHGYSAVTIRSVAKGCGVGVGTVYNYFSSKDELLASYLLRDWNRCIAVVRETSRKESTPAPVAKCMYEQLRSYAQSNRTIFQDENAASSFSGSFSRYHAVLRSQLSEPLRKFCKDEFASEFIAEALLVWTMAGKAFDEIYSMIEKLF